jgi:hypothetical protein
MELHQLRYVCAVAETGSFSRAAERCQIAQPSLSQQVLKLEEELGAKLFDRLGRGIRVTESGRAFLPHARAILDQVDIARASVASNNADVRGSVTLGAIPTIAPYMIPRYTAAFTKRFPDARLRIVEETTPVLIEGLRDLSIDFALLALPLRHKDLELQPIRTEPLSDGDHFRSRMTRPSGKTISVSAPAITSILWRARDSGAEMADSSAAVNLMVNGYWRTSRSVYGLQFPGCRRMRHDSFNARPEVP